MVISKRLQQLRREGFFSRPHFLWWASLSLTFAANAGNIETLDHHKYEGNVRVTESGTLSISSNANQQEQIPLEQIRIARINAPLFDPGSLPKGWRIEEIGEVRGVVNETNGFYTLRVTEGKPSRDAKAQMAYSVYRPLRGDGEVMARVQSVDGTPGCLAGVMLRDTLDPYSSLAFVAVTPDHHLRFDLREGGWQPIERRVTGKVTLPIWLKLVREPREKQKEALVYAFSSQDGKTWREIGQTKLAWRSEPVPEGSENWQPRLFAGIAITGPGTNTVWTSRMDQVAVTAHGLFGEYFADDRFHKRRFGRADAKVDFDWRFDAPGPGIEEDHFSIRWVGKVAPKFSENYRFYFDADNEAKLWVNGEELPQVSYKKEKKEYAGRELPLKSGEKYDIKIEFKEGAGEASMHLGWSSQSQRRQIIPSSQLFYQFDPNSAEDEDRTAPTNPVFAKGVWLRNGTFIAGDVLSCDDSATSIAWPGQKAPLVLPNTKIAHIVFRLSRRGLPLQLAENHVGIILKNGDFLEAELIGLKGRSLIVNSLLFGRRAFSLDNNDAIALVLNSFSPAIAPFEVRLMNGSALRAKGLRPNAEKVLVNDAVVGDLPVRQTDLFEIVNTAVASESSRLSNAR